MNSLQTWSIGNVECQGSPKFKENQKKKKRTSLHKPWGRRGQANVTFLCVFLGIALGGRGRFSRISFFHLHRKRGKHLRKQ